MDKALVLDAAPRRIAAFEAIRILPESYVAYWPDIEQELDKVPHIWNTHWTKESLYECGVSGRFQVWGFGPPDAINVVVYTHIVEFPAAQILQVFLAFGNSLELALPIMEATLEKFAMVTGCRFVEIIGRKGWSRKLPNYKDHRMILRRELSNYGVH